MQCSYCSGGQGRCATTASGRSVTECCACGRVVEERQSQSHDIFHLRAQDSPLCVVTSDLSSIIPSPDVVGHDPHHKIKTNNDDDEEDDPFEPTGFITAFSTWSLEPTPVSARSSLSFSGHLAELERAIDSSSSSSGPVVVVDNLRAYLQIIDVSSILGLDYDISDHAFQLFRDCSSATCLRNRSVEALATAALVQAIREAQEPRTLQEISNAANVPQKEIGKYIKILGEALQLSQPINSNSISVHMPRLDSHITFWNNMNWGVRLMNQSHENEFGTKMIYQLVQELATHIGEVVINKCFCTRRNPISISAAAIYLACQLEDKRKTQAEICKVTGLTEVTLRKVYKELLENWDDLLPSNYTPAVPPEKAFPTTAITGRSSLAPKVDPVEIASSLDKDKQPEVTKLKKQSELSETDHQSCVKEEAESKSKTPAPHGAANTDNPMLNRPTTFSQRQIPYDAPDSKQTEGKSSQSSHRGIDINETRLSPPELEQKVEGDSEAPTSSQMLYQFSGPSALSGSNRWPFHAPSSQSPYVRFVQPPQMVSGFPELKGSGNQKRSDTDRCGDTAKQ
ncbi:Transcription factor TFIIB [Macleaya cordata]|uniref:Transcription factor TFIIB n=1 Tax=Macleaya cordata TaxID=56857 RepID=A0A200Q233_MACCD|nr:Transcription factor TFIIB [Macleaya cordata]